MAVIGISIGLSFALALVCGPLLAPGAVWLRCSGDRRLGVIGMAIVAFGIPTWHGQRAHEDIGANARPCSARCCDPVLQRLNGSVFLLHFTLTASFLVVPAVIESSMGVPREAHWRGLSARCWSSRCWHVPAPALSERAAAQLLALRAGVLLMPASLAACSSAKRVPLWLYLGPVRFFRGRQLSRGGAAGAGEQGVFAHGKGTALGVYATCQFLGAFVGGTSAAWSTQLRASKACSGWYWLPLGSGCC
jgi:hypothetical protein